MHSFRILAPDTEVVIYWLQHSNIDDMDGFFDYIDTSWKALLIHTCRVASRLRQLEVDFPTLSFVDNYDQLDDFFHELSDLIDWGFTGLLPGMNIDCRFIANARYVVPAEDVVSFSA